MLKNLLLPVLLLIFFLISSKSMAVAHPEYIEWRAQPKHFVISLFRGVLDREPDAEWQISNLAFMVKPDLESRLKLFWTFISTEEYQASRWAKQKKRISSLLQIRNIR